MRRNRPTTNNDLVDDADVAAGLLQVDNAGPLASAPSSIATINTKGEMDLEFFEDLVSEPVLVLGMDISHLPRQTQFIVCAIGVFGFSLLYGYLQELIAVQLCNRKLGLFQAMMQFTGYTVLAYLLNNFVDRKHQHLKKSRTKRRDTASRDESTGNLSTMSTDSLDTSDKSMDYSLQTVPLKLYLGLSLLRALDLAMTNLAMQYINYPAKTLMYA